MDFSKFEEKSGVRFKNEALLKQAFTHRSYVNENKVLGIEHNERLEFLGDAILGFVIADYVFKKFPDMDEEELTTMRAALINWDTCAQVADKLEIEKYILISKGSKKDTVKTRRYLIADVLEAVIGAAYLDQGFEVSKNFILTHIAPLSDEIIKGDFWTKSPKSMLQEMVQEEIGKTPVYAVIRETGPVHDPYFTMSVSIGGVIYGQGEGRSKQAAEQEAAKVALEKRGWK